MSFVNFVQYVMQFCIFRPILEELHGCLLIKIRGHDTLVVSTNSTSKLLAVMRTKQAERYARVCGGWREAIKNFQK